MRDFERGIQWREISLGPQASSLPGGGSVLFAGRPFVSLAGWKPADPGAGKMPAVTGSETSIYPTGRIDARTFFTHLRCGCRFCILRIGFAEFDTREIDRMKRLLIAVFFVLVSSLYAADELAEGFKNPPQTALSWTYWWWLNSYVSEKGITEELEEFKRQGIGGVLIFPAGGAAGPMPTGPDFMSPEWVKLFQHALSEADRLGIEVSVNLCDGWDAGGPWITADAANKKLTFTEIQVEGAGAKTISVPMPPTLDDYYKDVAVVAIPEKATQPVRPALVVANHSLEGYCGEYNYPVEQAFDGDPHTTWRAPDNFPVDRSNPLWFQISYHEPIRATSLYLVPPENGNGPKTVYLQQSQNGTDYEDVLFFDMKQSEPTQVAFPEVSARRFRLIIHSAYGPNIELAECRILRDGDEPNLRPGIKWWLFKSGNRSFWDWPKAGPVVLEDEYAEESVPVHDYDPERIVDLSGKMEAEGKLTWDVPEGRWTIIRFGYTIQGQRTRCGSTTQPGYESDMLSPLGIESHFKHVAIPLLNVAGDKVGKTLKYLHIDSYELGADIRGQQPTYSHIFREEFQKRRGYDLLKYLPTQTGRIATSREITNRFLWDYRATIGDLMCDTFFKRFAELGHEHGVKVHSETGYGTYPHPHIDGLKCAGQNDIPMGEFWYGTDIMSQFYPFVNSIRGNASAAHIYGKNLVQAESFTTWFHFGENPYDLKLVGDKAFCDGLNRIVFHQSTYQDNTTDKPGFQYGAGTHIDRNITWWKQGKAWFEYLARCQYMLQQGRFHADFAYYYGEGATKFVPDKASFKPALPQGFDADMINTEVLLNSSVKNGCLTLKGSDMEYKALILVPQKKPYCEEVQAKLEALRQSGLPVLDKPDDQLTPDMFGAKEIDFIHRTADDFDIYFLANQSDKPVQGTFQFRNTGKLAEIWDPVDGSIKESPYFLVKTNFLLSFAPKQSFFIVFRKQIIKTETTDDQKPHDVEVVIGMGDLLINDKPILPDNDHTTLNGPWTVHFDPKWGGPASVVFNEMTDWTKRPEDGIKFYSGTATYKKTFNIKDKIRSGRKLFLGLGSTNGNPVEIRLNGKDLGVLWTAPWKVEITDCVKETGNELEIDVVNNWHNRLVGDAAMPPEKRSTKTNVPFSPQTPLQPSGLMGPVRIEVGEEIVPLRLRQ